VNITFSTRSIRISAAQVQPVAAPASQPPPAATPKPVAGDDEEEEEDDDTPVVIRGPGGGLRLITKDAPAESAQAPSAAPASHAHHDEHALEDALTRSEPAVQTSEGKLENFMIQLHDRVNIGSFGPFHDENDQFKKSSVSDDVVRVFCFNFCA
jgi:hypothetical protein